MEERHKVRVAVYLLLINEGKILLQRRFNTGWNDGNYTIGASGHMEKGESIMQAMVREAQEETGIDLKEEDLKVVHTMHRHIEEHEYIDFFITAQKYDGEIKIGEPDRIDELVWFPLDELPENIIPYLKVAIESFQKNITFSEVGWE